MTAIHPRITVEPRKRDGKPCIRGLRITVEDVLGWLAAGMTEAEILDDHPDLEKEDFRRSINLLPMLRAVPTGEDESLA